MFTGWLGIGAAWAADQSDMGANQLLEARTEIRIDILDPATETIEWVGQVVHPITLLDVDLDATVTDPAGAVLGVLSSGDTLAVTSAGTHRLAISGVDLDSSGDDELLTSWSVRVLDGASQPVDGRVWSTAWWFDAGGFSSSDATDASFYTVVEGGAVGQQGVVELVADGLAGFKYALVASSEGIRDGNGRSRPDDGSWTALSGFPVYLRAPDPDVVSYDVTSPGITKPAVVTEGTCNAVAPGWIGADFAIQSNVTGTLHVVCDLNDDGIYDLTSDDDVHRLERVGSGAVQAHWDGLDNLGDPIPEGTLSCELKLTVGEFHFVAGDIETAFHGVRMFEVDDDGDRSSLQMFWNDAEVQSGAVIMPDLQVSLEASGPFGLDSGSYTDAASANVNARSWGNFSSSSKGNQAYLDTYTWLDEDTAGDYDVDVLDVVTDGDVDQLPDDVETCLFGTDPTLADTDGDGVDDYDEAVVSVSDPVVADTDGDGILDGEELPDPLDPLDSDDDGVPDVLDSDDDGDGVSTLLEGGGDLDEDNVPNYLDEDADGDGVPDVLEGDNDTDGDGIIDALDVDDDGDGVATLLEDVDGDGDPTDDDSDDDSVPDYLDVDDDGDSVPTADEWDRDGDLVPDDDDEDDIPNYLDPDDDGDGIPTEAEGDGDSDGDGIPDYLDLDADNDTLRDEDEGRLDTDDDFAPDFQDADDDGDGIPTLQELGAAAGTPGNDDAPGTLADAPDTDGDGRADWRDADDDDDSVPTLLEGGFDDDQDADGVPNHHDLDSDADGIADAVEGADDVDGDGLRNFLDVDSDADGVADAVEGVEDHDGDGRADFVDEDDDDDGVITADEREEDTDGDGLLDRLDTDDDDDGLDTRREWDDALLHGRDVDADEDWNWVDVDADGDGIRDGDEGVADQDGDGVPDYLDPDGSGLVWYRGSGLASACSVGAPGGGLPGSVVWLLALGILRRRS